VEGVMGNHDSYSDYHRPRPARQGPHRSGFPKAFRADEEGLL
jgi:hypothetical protein